MDKVVLRAMQILRRIGPISLPSLTFLYSNFTADTYIHSAPAAHQRMASTLAENLSVLQELVR